VALIWNLRKPLLFGKPIAGFPDGRAARLALRSNFNFWKEVTGAKATIKNPALEKPVYSIYFAALFGFRRVPIVDIFDHNAPL